MDEFKVQLRPLAVHEVNLLLEGLKQLPFGHVNDLFHEVRNAAQTQLDEFNKNQKKDQGKAA